MGEKKLIRNEEKAAPAVYNGITPYPISPIRADNLKLPVFAALIALTLALVSCGGEPVVTIYAADAFFENYTLRACYYKNGTRNSLHNDADSSYAYAITASGGKVYAAGYFKRLSNVVRACYWDKDGNRIELHPDGASESYAKAIAVSGKNIYTAGTYKDNGVNKICYWINGGNPLTLTIPQGAEFFDIENIAVSGNSVYITGCYHCYDDEYGIIKACYWDKDGNFKDLNPVNSSGSFAYGVTASGNLIYIAGSYIEDSVRKACYWDKDGNRIDLHPGGASSSNAFSIAVSGGKVYAAGTYEDNGFKKICYWINGGTRVDLPCPEDANNFVARAIAVYRGKVYAADYYRDNGDKYHYCYWKDGEFVDLYIMDRWVRSIFITVR